MTRKTGRPASDSRIQAGNYHRVREDVGGISDGQFNQSTNVLCTRANSDAQRLRIRLQGEMHDAKHVLLVRRNGCQYLGTTASRRGAGVESPKEFTPPMQFRRFKDNSEAVRRDRVRQLFEVRYAEERTETGVLLFYAWLEKYHRELLPQQKRGDPYQYLKVDLEGLYE